MSGTEKLARLAQYSDNSTRLNLSINSNLYDYRVDLSALKDVARFLGFAEIKLLSIIHNPPAMKQGLMVTSRVYELESRGLPPKARWKRIEVFIDIEGVSAQLPQGFTELDRVKKIEALLKDELEEQGRKNYKDFSFPGLLLGDGVTFLAGMTITVLLMEVFKLNHPSNNEYILWGGVLIKQLLSAIDTLAHYHGTAHGSRFTALESTQLLNLVLLPIKLEATQILHLHHKSSNL